MQRTVLTIMGLTLLATTFGCASAATTASSTTHTTPGLKSLDGDTVLTGTTPEVIEGNLDLDRETVASSGLWMDASHQPAPTEAWPQAPSSFDRVYKLVLPADPGAPATEVASLRDRRTARQ